MRSIQVSDDAWVVLKSKQVELMKVTGKVQTIGTVASDIIVKSNQEGGIEMSFCCDCGKDKQAFLCLSCNDKWLEQAERRGRVEELKKFISWAEEESEGWQMSLDCYPTQLQLSKQIKELEGVE